jgi:hypothetical protein
MCALARVTEHLLGDELRKCSDRFRARMRIACLPSQSLTSNQTPGNRRLDLTVTKLRATILLLRVCRSSRRQRQIRQQNETNSVKCISHSTGHTQILIASLLFPHFPKKDIFVFVF